LTFWEWWLMSEQRNQVRREVLPIPGRPPVGLTTLDAKDPDTSFPPITQLRPPAGAPNVLVCYWTTPALGLRVPSAGR
jgi:hypothetical protein